MRGRSALAAVCLGAALLAPSVARADEASDRTDLAALNHQADVLVAEAEHQPPGTAAATFLKAGELLQATYQRFCGGSGPAGRFIPDSAVCEGLAFNSGHAFALGHDVSKAIPMYRKVVEDDERARAHSVLAARAARGLGGAYQALAIYDLAAEWFEHYALSNPKSPDAETSLTDAVILRLGLAHEEQAVRDASLYLKLYGASRPTMAAQIMLALALHHGEKESWEEARKVAEASMALFDRAPVDVQVQAHNLLARAHAHGRSPAAAKDEYAKTRALWKDPAGAEAALRSAWSAEEEWKQDKRLGKALNAVGEATFAAAEDRRIAEVEPLKFPVYVGPAETAAVTAHLETKVRPWFEKKRAAIAGVETALVQILELKPVPPPRWVIAAGATVGAMWGSLADDFRRVPIPEAWRKNRVLYRAYFDAVDQMSESIRARSAKPAAQKCVDLSTKYLFQDERTRVCELWLAKNYKTEFHLVDEIIPSFRASRAPAEATPFTYEGQPLRH